MQNNGYFSLFLMLPWQLDNHDNPFQHSRLLNFQSVLEQTLNPLSIMNINKVTLQRSEKCKIVAIFLLFFCNHGNQITMTTNFNILGCQKSRVFKNKL